MHQRQEVLFIKTRNAAKKMLMLNTATRFFYKHCFTNLHLDVVHFYTWILKLESVEKIFSLMVYHKRVEEYAGRQNIAIPKS